MSTLDNDLKKLSSLFNKPDTLIYIALSMLSSDKESIIPEMLYSLDLEKLTRFITIYGGETVYIPTVDELRIHLNAAICSYYILVQKKKWPWITEKLGLSKEEFRKCKAKHYKWVESIPKHELCALKNLKESGEL